MRWITAFAALAFCIGAAPPPTSDTVFFKNGDRLTGEFISLVKGKISFKAKLIGEVAFLSKDVSTLETASEQEIHGLDGSVVVAAVRPDEEGSVRTFAPGTGSGVQLRMQEIQAINPPSQEPDRLSGSITAGAEFERGNTHKNSAEVSFKSRYEYERHEVDLRVDYDGERTKNTDTRRWTTNDRNLIGILEYDYFFTPKAFVWAGTSAEKDGPSDLNLRLHLASGIGYRWANREDFKLSARIGPAWSKEDYDGSSRDDEFFAALLGWNLERLIFPRVRFFHNGRWYPSLEDFDDRQLWRTETGIRTDITSTVFFEAKVEWELDTEPASNTERQDTDYVLGLGYKF
jgi:putative salt-induced outer membrane protein YdiY